MAAPGGPLGPGLRLWTGSGERSPEIYRALALVRHGALCLFGSGEVVPLRYAGLASGGPLASGA
jgi:hypothetical protein